MSLLFHISFVVGLKYAPRSFLDKSEWHKKAIEIDILSETASHRQKAYIKDPEVGDHLINRLTEKVDLLSKEARRVRQPTVAKRSGIDKNVLKPSRSYKASKPRQIPAKDSKKLLVPKDFQPKNGLLVQRGRGTKQKSRKNNVGVNLGMLNSQLNQSSISTYHPDIKTADITALDTDKGSLQYYTFHLRLREQLRPRWIQILRDIINSVPQSTLKRIGIVPRITTLEVILDKDGQYVGAIIVNSSSERLLDIAAKESFKKAAPFVNPPKDMVEEDGYIYLPFSFRLELNTRRFARRSKQFR